jgi:serine/threonine protein kinase/TolB-like protein/Flp pilus assembly protein TadD
MERQITPERWGRVKQIFQAALDLAPASRAAYLTDACAGDPSLLTEVESLLAAHEQPGSFMDSPAVDLAATDRSTDRLNTLGKGYLGRYQIVALLGRGGMGEVYKAKDPSLGREVAIKVLTPGLSIDRNRLRRFEQEARAASSLNHPNIITIHEFGHEHGIHFIVSEFIEGETLRRRLAGERMSPAAVVDIAIQITSALNAAHEAGIVHRDIKPENIMVRPDGLVKVLDFGLAKLVEHQSVETVLNDTEASTAVWGSTRAGAVLGTVNYMSPEQARGQKLDARTDIFSLGVVLYEMVAGRSPFAHGTTADVIASILEKEPPPLAQFTTEVPELFEAIIGKALCKDREKRYKKAGELLADLKRLKSGEAVIAPFSWKKESLIGAIKRRGRSLAVTLAALVAIVFGAVYLGGNDRAIESIAVLPFVNADGNPEVEYLADGIAECMINCLSQVSSLTVRPPNSVSRYKRGEVDPLAAGRELDVEAVLTGQVAMRGNEVNIGLRLIDVRENRQLWGSKYSGRAGDLLLIEAQIARDVTENMRLQLSPVERQQLGKPNTENAEAHQLYMQGRYFWNQRTGEGNRKAIEFFTQATELDPSFALAHAGLADCYVLGGNYRISVHEAMSKARAAALRALKLDDTLAEAHTSLAQVHLFYDWDFAEAEASFKRAIALKPSYETAHHWYAIMLAIAGRFPEAIERIKLAQALAPVSLIITKDAGLIYYYAGQYEQAIAQCKKTLDMSPAFYSAHTALGEIYLRMGRKEEAIAELLEADRLSEGRLITKVTVGYAYAVSGQRKKALAMLDDLRKESKGRPVSAYYLAVLYTGLGQKDEAFKWLEQALRERAYRMVYLKIDPVFDSLRPDPRFAELLERGGLAE